MPFRLGRALRAQGVRCDAVMLDPRSFPPEHPEERVNPPWGETRRLIGEADVIHVHGLTTFALFEAELAGRPVLLHIHGDPDRRLALRLEVPQVVSTPDLLAPFPQAVYCPNLILPDELPLSAPLGGGPLRIFKSPSLHDKHQELFAQLLDPILRQLPGRVVYVAPNSLMRAKALAQVRASCHVSLDHLHGYYGLESLEALAQGLVAVNGLSAQGRLRFTEAVGAPPPFAVARSVTEAGTLLVTLVEEALTRPERFAARRAAGVNFIQRYYRPERLVGRWLAMYAAVAERRWQEPAAAQAQEVAR
ncbi:MAG: hypothetical protein IT371_28155 [Deltaproteobacteria bacterium]|nr:hypothetical protein [Deltaproteobacteria bacterium]